MYGMSGMDVIVERDIETILIPDGTPAKIAKNSTVFIQQVLGGMFTVQTQDGFLMRIDGNNADALGQPIPEDRQKVSQEQVAKLGLEACIMQQLKTCYDPEIPVNIVDLGLIYECEVGKTPNLEQEYPVNICMTLTAPGCGMGEILKQDIITKIQEIPSVSEVLVDLVFDPPWESSLMSEAAKLQLGFL